MGSHCPQKSTGEMGLMKFTVETEREEDGRWIAEVSEIPGVLKYGQSREEAIAQAEALALRVIADRIEHGEQVVEPIHITFAAA
jgi:predicted RNase H-like HicB family nuclease